MVKRTQIGSVVLVGTLLAGCGSIGNSFSNPFGGGATPPVRVASNLPPQQGLPVLTPSAGGRPSAAINASTERVQSAIIARAKSRGTTVLGANRTGVTLEIPLKASSPVVEDQCGPHRADRTLRVYLETLPNGAGTIVSEDRFVIDGGATSCQLKLTDTDVTEGNRSLADLKKQSEAPRTSVASGPTIAGNVEPLNPGRPVVPLR